MTMEPHLEWDLSAQRGRHLDLPRSSNVNIELVLRIDEYTYLAFQPISDCPYLLQSLSLGQTSDVFSNNFAVVVFSIETGVH